MIAIGLGDYLDAVRALDAAENVALCRRIAEVLGVQSRAVTTPKPGAAHEVASAAQLRPERVREDQPAQDERKPSTGAERPSEPSVDEPVTQDVEVEISATAGTGPGLAMPQLAAPSGPSPRLPHEPLFEPQRSRALIGAALASTRAEGEIDEAALIEQIARARPVLAIPRRTRATLARGVQVLVDLGPSMLPFRRDQDDLLLRIDRLITDGLFDARTFDGDPRQAWSSRRRRMRGYELPRPGTPVLALTDLGLRDARDGRALGVASWLAFAAGLAHAQIPFLALVPYPPAAVPRILLERIAVVQWDRPTTVSSVQRAATKARRR